MTREEKIAANIQHRENEVADYDFEIESLTNQLDILREAEQPDKAHVDRIQKLLTQAKQQRAIAATALAAMQRMQAAQ